MALKVIGAGWGRTGTESLKKALELLGFNKCYHMFELIKDGSRLIYWQQLSRGEKPDYEKLFEGYLAAVDGPSCIYYKEFMVQYPDAKVILTVRDPEKWFESASKTILNKPPAIIFKVLKVLGIFSKRLAYIPKIFVWIEDVFFQKLLYGKLDKETVLSAYNKWNAEVIKNVPADKLLIYEVKDGWEPLCNFLNVPVPDLPFPKSNDSDSFQERIKLKNIIKGES